MALSANIWFIDDITGFDAADLDRDLIAERLKKDHVMNIITLFFFLYI
jgi:hypothetical protein